MTVSGGNILERLVAARRKAIARRIGEMPPERVQVQAKAVGPARDFARAIKQGRTVVIAEVKRASPSKGWLQEGLDPAGLARSYAAGGAAAVSVLTEPDFFKGNFDDLEQARGVVALPVLCKDFIVSPYQLFEARAHGADAVLLIASLLSEKDLRVFIRIAGGMGMAALVEAHDEAETRKALGAGASIVGINNRNLSDFTVDLGTTLRLRPLLPAGVTVVSESGVSSRADVLRLEQAGVDAVLVGEALVKSDDPAARVRELLGEA